ncbi:MAG: methyltransferase domain-containing protein [Actinomycetota bacterium]
MSDPVHRAASAGFAAAADAYDRGRPSYPLEAVAWLARTLRLHSGTTLLELGAGTGKLTAQLVPLRTRVVAVEPIGEMRERLAEAVPSALPLGATAESLPLGDGTIDAAVAAQAFHWFDHSMALDELARVLRPAGRLALAWNVRDRSVDWSRRLTEIVDRVAGDTPRHGTAIWQAAFTRTDRFDVVDEASFPNPVTVTPSQLMDRVESISFVAAAGVAAREEVLEDVRKLLASHRDLAGHERIVFPYRTDVYAWECSG